MAFRTNALKKFLFIVLVWAFPASLPAVTPSVPALPHEYVVDLADVMDADA